MIAVRIFFVCDTNFHWNHKWTFEFVCWIKKKNEGEDFYTGKLTLIHHAFDMSFLRSGKKFQKFVFVTGKYSLN